MPTSQLHPRRRPSPALLAALLAAAAAVPATPTTAQATPQAVPAANQPASVALARGDAAYARRAEGARGDRAAPGPIGEAVAAYGEALQEAPGDAARRVKLLQALYFQSEYATESDDARLAIVVRARDLAEEGLEQLAALAGAPLRELSPEEVARRLAGAPPAATGIPFWAAVHWGLWGRLVGKLSAARQGVADRIRDHAAVVVALDEEYEEGGGHRVLGRLHFEAPRIPFVTGWVDRDAAVRHLERAYEIAPANTINRLYLGEALLELRPARRGEALDLLDALAADEPRPGWEVEDARAMADARALLAAE